MSRTKSPLTRNNVEYGPMPPSLMLLLWRYLARRMLADEAYETYDARPNREDYRRWLELSQEQAWAGGDLYDTLTPYFGVRFRAGGYEVAQVHLDRRRDTRMVRIRQYR